MRLSLVVCTRNRAEALAPALASYAKLACSESWELVLVNNGSTDATALIVNEFAQDTHVAVQVVDEPLPGLSRARNRGLSVASGEVIAFTDDDCYPATDFLESTLRGFSQPNVAFLGGRVLLFDPTDLPMTIQELDDHIAFEPYSYIRAGLIHGANMAFRRSVLLEIGGFDERLGAGAEFHSGEDTDAIIRCVNAGYSGCYDPRAVVHHHHGRKRPEEAASLRKNYAIGRGACMVKHSLNPVSRAVYARRWYWHLLGLPWSMRSLELRSAIRFVLSSGVTPARVFRHPHDSLGVDLSCTDV